MTNDKQKDRLVELLQEASAEAWKHFRETTKKVLAEKGRFNSATDIDRRNIYEVEADHLLANSVIVPPCKAGDTVYAIYDKKVYEAVCEYVTTVQHKEGSFTKIKAEFDIEDSLCYDGRKTRFGVYGMYEADVFLSREEAEQALVNYESSKNDTARKEDENGKKQ